MGAHMKGLRRIFLTIGLLVIAPAAQSQVFQWKDPDSGVTRISNSAPAWYREAFGENRKPRIQVFYYGVLVDDTSLSFKGRQDLRGRTYIGRYLPRMVPPTHARVRR